MATALVTGASSGIGLELARLFAADGHDLVLVARRGDALKQLAAELGSRHGVRATVIAADLADPIGPAEIARSVEAAGLEIEFLVNNAGYGMHGRFAQADAAEELAMLQVNVVALTHLTSLFLPAMLARGRGRVMNVASTAAFQPGPLMAVYYASKAYVLSFTEALAEEVRGTGVTVTALCPGPTTSGFQARARMEAARLVRINPFMADAASVAAAGYAGLMRGKRIVIPGIANKLLAQSVRFAPRVFATKVAALLNGAGGGERSR